MVIDDLHKTLQTWVDALKDYDNRSLLIKPAIDSWSIGQVYMHLIDETIFFLSQARACLSTNKNAEETASAEGLQMLSNNSFPDELIDSPPSNQFLQQPTSREQILTGLEQIRVHIDEVQLLLKQSTFRGKSKHPGLQYLDAHQWCQFAEMHLRHHFKQKQRIDEYLRDSSLKSFLN